MVKENFRVPGCLKIGEISLQIRENLESWSKKNLGLSTVVIVIRPLEERAHRSGAPGVLAFFRISGVS